MYLRNYQKVLKDFKKNTQTRGTAANPVTVIHHNFHQESGRSPIYHSVLVVYICKFGSSSFLFSHSNLVLLPICWVCITGILFFAAMCWSICPPLLAQYVTLLPCSRFPCSVFLNIANVIQCICAKIIWLLCKSWSPSYNAGWLIQHCTDICNQWDWAFFLDICK